MISICFTGHRPNKLFGYDILTEGNQQICQQTYDIVEDIIKKDLNQEYVFYHGGALGYDFFSFFVIMNLKANYPKVKIKQIMTIPFKKQYIKWKKEDIGNYFYCLKHSDEIIYVDRLEEYSVKNVIQGIYHPAKMQKRNEYMVDHSDIVIACYDGSNGGTKNCITYAEKLGKNIIKLNPNNIRG